MSKQILSEEKTENRIDPETGELIETTISKTFSIQKEGEPFYITYLKGITVMYGVSSPTAFKLLIKFMELVPINSTEVQISAPKKKQILEELNISKPAYIQGINILKEKGLITGSRGLYNVSEDILWKGYAKEREILKKKRAVITIKPNGDFEENL